MVDFYCKELQLAVEVDGNSHNFKKTQDGNRQKQLEAFGIRFLRFWDCEIKNEIGSVVDRINAWIKATQPRSVEENTAEKSPPVEGCRNGGVGLNERPPEKTSSSLAAKRGSALIVVLWILIILSLIVSLFAFEMQLESKVISLQRKRFKADQLALSGIEMAKTMLAFKEDDTTKDAVGKRIPNEDPWVNEALKIVDGIPVDFSEVLGDGTIKLRVDYENGRRNIKIMTHDDWKLLFDQAGISNTRWDSMLDCLDDWQDEGDEHRLNGAESDDPFYRKRGYECKNAPVDTVDELLLIKNWGEEILYGTPDGETTDKPVAGIADQLTTWGSGKINPNSASQEVLNSLTISEATIDAILELRLGPDGKAGTEDDGITAEDFTSMGLDAGVFTLQPEYVKVTAIGDVAGVQSQISCIFKLGEKEAVPLFWLEGNQEENRHQAP